MFSFSSLPSSSSAFRLLPFIIPSVSVSPFASSLVPCRCVFLAAILISRNLIPSNFLHYVEGVPFSSSLLLSILPFFSYSLLYPTLPFFQFSRLPSSPHHADGLSRVSLHFRSIFFSFSAFYLSLSFSLSLFPYHRHSPFLFFIIFLQTITLFC